MNDLFTKLKKDYLITQIKNELLKKMIEDDKKQMGEITNYEFAKSWIHFILYYKKLSNLI